MHFFVRADEDFYLELVLESTTCVWLQMPQEEGTHSPVWNSALLLPPLVLRTDAKLLPFLGKPGNPKSGTFPPCFRAVLLRVQAKPPIAVKTDDVKFTIIQKKP